MKPININVSLGARSYPIRISADFQALAALLGSGRQALLVSDEHVAGSYGSACRTALETAGFRVTPITIPAGESSKTLSMAERLYTAAAAAGLDRTSHVVALGGGVVGDLAGFVAATYLRGLSLIQVPTSLLAMVDSSVGGKTAVNLDAGKNLVGSFHQPTAVLINLETLRTLPQREYRSGLAEVIKYGLIFDAAFYNILMESRTGLRDRDPVLLSSVIRRCCELKADVVARDERESGPRALLNFGHTLGHAVEAWAGYGRWLHGEAVSIGMVYAAHLSRRQGGLSTDDVAKLETQLTALDLPVRLPAQPADWTEIRRRMQIDKKCTDGSPRFILLEAIGRAVAGRLVAETDLSEVWNVICH